ncbi:MAG TPA: type II toxin-antitoxin system ParD family antitoxin [Stellaceae bacterium]
MATMNVSLSKEFAEFVDSQVTSGAYASASEVVRDGLRLLRREQAAHDEKIEILRREIGVGVEQARQGRFSTQSVADICAEIDAEER